MKFSVRLIENNQTIQKEIMDALLKPCAAYMEEGIAKIKSELPNIVFSAIMNRPEYNSLVSGKLRLEFGIPDANSKVLQLLQVWSNNISYTYNKPTIKGSGIRSYFGANLIRSDFSDVLGIDAASVQDNIKGYNLPWLRWLLLDGSAVLIPTHSVVLGPNNRSRTGMAIMKESMQGWRVPSEFSGTQNDNWITRAITDASQDINTLLNKAFKP